MSYERQEIEDALNEKDAEIARFRAEVERLTLDRNDLGAEILRLRAALEDVAYHAEHGMYTNAHNIARTALRGEEVSDG